MCHPTELKAASFIVAIHLSHSTLSKWYLISSPMTWNVHRKTYDGTTLTYIEVNFIFSKTIRASISSNIACLSPMYHPTELKATSFIVVIQMSHSTLSRWCLISPPMTWKIHCKSYNGTQLIFIEVNAC